MSDLLGKPHLMTCQPIFRIQEKAIGKAIFIFSTVEGALILARAYNIDYFKMVIDQIKSDLNRE
ncbi:MAG: hypothetical protein GPJ54_19105 [Candidatus Heimdallarchaeota archaeon]|nr:hypothetical protein [Candidatus Heimdallarchaeota archaeon]